MIQYSTLNILDFPKDFIIVNAANARLKRGAGVCGAIFAYTDTSWGPGSLDAECNDIIRRRKKPIRVGSSVVTPAYGYIRKAIKIIHAVGPIYASYRKEEAYQLLAKTYLSIMNHMAPSNTVVIPAISCGIYGFPIPDACSIAVNTVKHWQIMNWKTPVNVILNAYDPKVKAEYIKLGIEEYP